MESLAVRGLSFLVTLFGSYVIRSVSYTFLPLVYSYSLTSCVRILECVLIMELGVQGYELDFLFFVMTFVFSAALI